MELLDSAVTVLLFIALLGWVWAGVIVGVTSVMMSDSGAPGLAWVGVLLAVFGVPATVIITYAMTAVAAVRADGLTFYYPLVALVLGTVAAAAVLLTAYGIVWLNLALFGTGERKRRASEPVVVPDAPAPAPSYPVFTYTAIHRIPDQAMSIELGVEQHTGRRYLRTPMPQRGGEYDEYHGIDVATYATFGADPGAALLFAAECRAGLHRNLWLPPAGFPALQPITVGQGRLAGKNATLLTDRPTTAAGTPVTGLPLGTPFVRIVDDSPDRNGDLGVRLPTGSDVVRVAAQHLGRPS